MDALRTAFPRDGRLVWIGLTPVKRGPVTPVARAVIEEGTGIEGDHHARSGRGKRQVTLIQQEHLDVIAALAGREVTPDLLRRNLVVAGINVFALRHARFRVGSVLLEGTGACAPCSRMEAALGAGGFNAMRGHGGITATVIEAGVVELGDPVSFVALGERGRDLEE